MADSKAYFKQIVRDFGPRLANTFGLSLEDTAAVFGNLGHESNGMRSLQEKKPLIPGSKGGFGWAQWTGPRRKQYEAFCKKAGYKPVDNDANFDFLCWELKNTETKAIPNTKKAPTLYKKVVAFELGFERAHPDYKHYPSRMVYAELAKTELMKIWEVKHGIADIPETEIGHSEQDAPTEEIPHGQTTDQIEWVQERLLRAGYVEVGIVNGKWGSGTAAAIAAYSNDQHLNAKFGIDDELIKSLQELPSSFKRRIADEREQATARDLEATMPTVKQTRIGRWTAKVLSWLGIPTVGLGVASDASDGVKAKVMPIYETVSNSVPTLLTKWWFWGGLGLVAVGTFWRILRYSATEAPVEDAYRERRLLR